MATIPPLTTFKALSFDCYGTLIDWESGLLRDLSPILSRLVPSHPWSTNPTLALSRFNDLSDALEISNPSLTYASNLRQSFAALAAEAGVSLPFRRREHEVAAAAEEEEEKEEEKDIGTGPSRWAAFPDTIAALERLSKHYKLIILSNVDRANISAATATGQEQQEEEGEKNGGGALKDVKFAAIYTAEEIGSYKPSHTNFQYLFKRAKEDLGIDWEKGELLHVARSLVADHVPAKELGLRSVWISRGGEREEGYGVGGNLDKLQRQGKLGFEWQFGTLGEMAEEVERQFGEVE